MDLSILQARIQVWENLHTEFKEWPISPATCAESLVAFANTDGGQFILGVDKNSKSLVCQMQTGQCNG